MAQKNTRDYYRSASSLTAAEYKFALAKRLRASIGLLYVADKAKEVTSVSKE